MIPHFSLNLDQVRDSRLLSPERMAAVEAEIERRFSIPLAPDGKPITNARVIDCGEHGLHLFPVMTHESNWEYARRTLLGCVLTEGERAMLDRSALGAASQRREEEKLAKATKVPESEWDGHVMLGDTYYDSVYECVEDRINDGEEPPLYVWPAVAQPVIRRLDVMDVIENQISEYAWEDFDEGDLHGAEELQRALDVFVEANKGVGAFWPDESRAIVVDQEAARKQVEESK